jgi:hypothetical protein
MINNNVYYIKVKPYMHSVAFKDMAERFYKSNNIKIDKIVFVDNVYNYMETIRLPIYEKTQEELNIDNIVSKTIINHLNIFMNKKINEKTQKIKKQKKNKTLKL